MTSDERRALFLLLAFLFLGFACLCASAAVWPQI